MKSHITRQISRSCLYPLAALAVFFFMTAAAQGQGAVGACCVNVPPICIITSAADCQGQGGIYFGDGSTCNPDPCSPRGACCLVDAVGLPFCAEITEADCAAQGGVYQGDFTLCIPDPCVPEGACCITDAGAPPICIITTAADCQLQGGVYQGDGTTCTPDPCVPTGACCLVNPPSLCIIATAADCLAQGGSYQGDGTTCTPDPCIPTGACCRSDGAGGFLCFQTTAADCQAQGGIYQGDGVSCVPDPCPETGACCITDPGTAPICIITTAADCQLQGGVYQGDGTTCTPDPCNPTGACCYDDPLIPGFICIITTAFDCFNLPSSTYFGNGTNCANVECPPDPVGACCLDDPVTGQCTCIITTQADCILQGGVYLGDNILCNPDPCCPLQGACCVPEPGTTLFNCIITTAFNCQTLGGNYLGDGSSCSPDPCIDPVGACCMDAGAGLTCVIVTQLVCDQNNGTYFGDGSICALNLCNPPTGACCIPALPPLFGFTCIITTAADCAVQGGDYQGDGITCNPWPCPAIIFNPVGACCYQDAAGLWTCTVTNAPTCQFLLGGVYQGNGVSCFPNPCPPNGACCFIDAAGIPDCTQTSEVVCDSLFGTFFPNGVCPFICDPPTICGDPASGSCFAANGSPGCDDAACCQLVCFADPFCCNVTWDVNCVAQALVLCTEPPCPDPQVFKCTAGNRDDFDTTEGPEPSSPSAPLLTVMNACSLGSLSLFDVVPDNRCFGHTFTNCWPGCCDMVQSAILEIRLRAHPTDPLTVTDTLQFREDGVGVFSTLISNLPGTGGTWNPGQTATLFLDLGALNPAIIASMQDGDLDVMIQDDTGVDYMCLTVVACPCPNPFGVRIIQGNIDNFNNANGPEPTTPSAELQTQLNQCFNSINSYDVVPCNACIGDTFTNLPSCIISANLTIGLCTNGTCLSSNDSLSLEVIGPSAYAWGLSIATLTGLGWNTPQCATITLDLANLPASGSGVQNIMSFLQDGDLDVRVQDDTGIDFMFLDIQYCECCPQAPPCNADLNNSGTVDVTDLLLLLGQWGPCPPGCVPGCDDPVNCAGDANDDCVVDVTDLLKLLGGWGACP